MDKAQMERKARVDEAAAAAAAAAGLKEVDREKIFSYSSYPIPANRPAVLHRAYWREMKAKAEEQAKATGQPVKLPEIPLPPFLREMGHEKAMELAIATSNAVRAAREARFKARAEDEKQRELERQAARNNIQF